MKVITIISAFLLIVLTILAGLIFPGYETINVIQTSVVITINAILVYISLSALKDAFKISLSFLFAFFATIECVLTILSPQEIENNIYVMVVLSMIIVQILILTTVKLLQK